MRIFKHLTISFFLLIPLLTLTGGSLKHTIQKGDTLYSLSQKYNVSVDKIMTENDLNSAKQLKIGMNLKIPSNVLDFNQSNGYIDKTSYIVKKGDTLYSISRSFGFTVKKLLNLNGLVENHVLRIGEVLVITAEGIPPGVPNKTPVPNPIGNDLFWPTKGMRSELDGKLQGVRIEAEAYSYVKSIAAGKVVIAEPYRGFGNVILIDVGGYIYLYGGNEDIFVNVGEVVAAGTRIGRLGMSDLSNGKKDMFFSVFKDGKPVDVAKAPRG